MSYHEAMHDGIEVGETVSRETHSMSEKKGSPGPLEHYTQGYFDGLTDRTYTTKGE